MLIHQIQVNFLLEIIFLALIISTINTGVIYFDNNFYAVTTSGDDSNIFPIRKSENLRDWDLIGYMYSKINYLIICVKKKSKKNDKKKLIPLLFLM